MRRVLGAGVFVLVVAAAQSAWAQGTDPDATHYAGLNVGVSVVEKPSAAVGGDAGMRVWKNLDGVITGFWTPNAVTRRQLDNADRLAAVLGTGASGSIKVPVTYGGLGARWVFEQGGSYRPYILATAGAARTNLKPSFSVGGADVTGSLDTYGVTLGSDLAGTYSRFGAEIGLGFVKGFGAWYVDVGARYLSIQAPDQRIGIPRLAVTGGYQF